MDKLCDWFSSARMSRYAAAVNPGALYVWDDRLSKAYLEDVAHVEILLRNFITSRLAVDYGRRYATEHGNWFDNLGTYNLDDKFASSVARAKLRISYTGKEVTYDRVIAALSFDVWRYLLVKRLEPTVWKAVRDKRNGGMPHYPGASRSDFEQHVSVIYTLRNRCSHQEHLVQTDLDEESRRLDFFSENIYWVAEKIDPAAAEWIWLNSRVTEVRASRPLG